MWFGLDEGENEWEYEQKLWFPHFVRSTGGPAISRKAWHGKRKNLPSVPITEDGMRQERCPFNLPGGPLGRKGGFLAQFALERKPWTGRTLSPPGTHFVTHHPASGLVFGHQRDSSADARNAKSPGSRRIRGSLSFG
jgi:hypothetical protein